jgi:ketosteroid isomerase-like protein
MVITPEQTARLFYDALEPGRRQDLMMVLDPHVVLEIPEGLPGSRVRYEGLAAYRDDFLFDLYGAFDVGFAPAEFLEAGERVTVLGRLQGRTVASGVAFDVPFCHVWTIRAGRLVHGRFFTDTAVLAQALRAKAA